MDSTKIINRVGANLVVNATILDSSNAGVTSGVTVTASIYKVSTSKYWNTVTNSFSLAAEPSLIALSHVANGLYELSLLGGAGSSEEYYRVHVTVTGTQTANFSITDIVPMSSVDIAIASRDKIMGTNLQYLAPDGPKKSLKVWNMISALFSTIAQRTKEYTV